MIDIHSHIIFDIDDGCTTKEESINTLINLKNIGFNKIVLTPHYMKGSNYIKNNEIKINKYNELKRLIKENDIDIDIYLGNEIYINSEIHELILDNEIYTMNNTKYILVELPLYNEINNVEDYIYELKLKGYIPIIAHPERYQYFQKNYKKLNKLYDSGVLFQCNYGSIIGVYGKSAKDLIKYILKNNMVTFMATDIHKPNFSIIDNFSKITKKIKKITGEEEFNNITHNNALKMLNDKTIEY